MRKEDRERVQRANGNGVSNGSANSAPEKRSHQNANQGAGNIKSKLDGARNDIKNSAKSYILAGISDALEEIANGDFGDFGDEVFEGFNKLSEGLDQSSKQLIDDRVLPKYLPQSEAEEQITVDVEAN